MKPTISKIFALSVIALVAVIVYANSLHNSFQYDDRLFIVDNPAIRDIHDFPALWNFPPSRTRFISVFTFALNYHFHKLDVLGYHLTNLVIHIGCGIFVFLLLELLWGTPAIAAENRKKGAASGAVIALIAALIFIAHPVQTQAVTYISQRMASLAALFYLASIYFYIKGRLKSDKSLTCVGCFCGSFLLAVFGMLTKEIVISLPLAVVLLEWFFFKPEGGYKSFRKMHGLLLAAIVFALLIIPALLSFQIAEILFAPRVSLSHAHETITFGKYVLTQFKVSATLLRLFFIPVRQNLDYDFPLSRSLWEPATFGSFAMMLVLWGMAVKFFTRHRMLSFGIFWFWLTLLPEFVPRPFLIFEHKLYLPSFGLCILLSVGLNQLIRNSKMYIITTSVIILGLSFLTFERNKIWRNEVTLWQDVIKKSPNKASAHLNLGVAYAREGDEARAIAQMNEAIELDPALKEAYNSRGTIRAKQKFYDLALADYERAFVIDPRYAEALYNIGIMYQKNDQPDQALHYYARALEVNPKYVQVYNNRCGLYIDQGKMDLALEDMNKAIETAPGAKGLYLNRGQLYESLKQYDKALKDYERIVQLDARDVSAHFKKANVYFILNDPANMRREADRILKKDPGNRRAQLIRARPSAR